MPDQARLEQVLDMLHGPRDSFRRDLTDIDELMAAVCDYAEDLPKKKRVPAWSIIGQITQHGSGVSNAIYELYRRRDKKGGA